MARARQYGYHGSCHGTLVDPLDHWVLENPPFCTCRWNLHTSRPTDHPRDRPRVVLLGRWSACPRPAMSYARFTLADPMPWLASDVVGGKSEQSHLTSRRDPIRIGRMAHNAYIRVGWYGEGVLFITTPSERQLHCTRSAPDRPTTSQWSPDEAPTANAGSGAHSHWPSRQHRGTIGASNWLICSGHYTYVQNIHVLPQANPHHPLISCPKMLYVDLRRRLVYR